MSKRAIIEALLRCWAGGSFGIFQSVDASITSSNPHAKFLHPWRGQLASVTYCQENKTGLTGLEPVSKSVLSLFCYLQWHQPSPYQKFEAFLSFRGLMLGQLILVASAVQWWRKKSVSKTTKSSKLVRRLVETTLTSIRILLQCVICAYGRLHFKVGRESITIQFGFELDIICLHLEFWIWRRICQA